MVKLVERRVEARVLEPLRMTERHGITCQAHRFVLEFAGQRCGSREKGVAARGYRHRIVFAAGCGPRVVHRAGSLLIEQCAWNAGANVCRCGQRCDTCLLYTSPSP